MPQRRTLRSFSLEEKGAAEATWSGLGLTATPILCPTLHCIVGRQQSQAWERREGWEEEVFKIRLFSALPHSDCIGDFVVLIKFILFPQVVSVLPVTVIGE